jgi:hypothetical protein
MLTGGVGWESSPLNDHLETMNERNQGGGLTQYQVTSLIGEDEKSSSRYCTDLKLLYDGDLLLLEFCTVNPSIGRTSVGGAQRILIKRRLRGIEAIDS